MPIRYTILKKNRLQAVVKVVGNGQVTIPLSELALADETLNTPKVGITFMYWNINPTSGFIITVKRGANDVYYLTGGDNWNLSQGTGFVDNEFATQDITINTNDNATLILTLNKAGYKEPDTQAWDKSRTLIP